jgi:hypothetical protein
VACASNKFRLEHDREAFNRLTKLNSITETVEKPSASTKTPTINRGTVVTKKNHEIPERVAESNPC